MIHTLINKMMTNTMIILSIGFFGYSVKIFTDTYRVQNDPRYYDLSSTRQIMKKNDINLYFEKEKEYNVIIEKIGNLVNKNKIIERSDIADSLNELRNSPFYNKENKHIFKNLWKLQSRNVEELSSIDLDNTPCLQRNKKDKCTKKELLFDLYESLRENKEI